MQDTVDMLLDVQSTLDIVQLLKANETLLNRLYRLFAGQYPEQAGFWNRIASDENEHAGWVSRLYNEIETSKVRFRKDRFVKTDLAAFSEYVTGLADEVTAKPLSLLDAAGLSVRLEDSMIEKNFFRVFESDVEILKITMQKLEASTEIHYAKVKSFLAEISGK